jgi:hypothetical protein
MSGIFMNCSRATWRQLNLCFNSCVRYAFLLRKFDSLSRHRDEILGCSLENYVKFRSCCFMFRLLKKKSPLYLFNMISFPRYPRGRALSFPSNYVTNSQSFFVFGVHLWNSLSSEIRSLDSAEAFQQKCLTYLALERA